MALGDKIKGRFKNLLEASKVYIDNQNANAAAEKTDTAPATITTAGAPSEVTVPTLRRPGGNFPKDLDPPQISAFDIEESDVLGEISSVISDLVAGDLPDEVVSTIEKTSAEKGISTGVFGQAQEFSTAAAIGRSTLELQAAGIEAGLNLAQIETQRDIAEADVNTRISISNQNTAAAYAQLQESTRQWEDKMALSMTDTELNVDRLQLAASELVLMNQQHTQRLINEIIVSNSRYAIEGAQDVIDELVAFSGISESAVLRMFGINVG